MQIVYTNNRHGYVRAKPDGSMVVRIPSYLKNNTKFVDVLMQKAEKMEKKLAKMSYIRTADKNTVMLFGEEVSWQEVIASYAHVTNQKQQQTILKQILLEYVTPLCDTYASKLGYAYQKVSVRKVTSKRGSCTHDQKIMFNVDLVHLATKHIKYVVIHEICHLKEKNHSARFWALVEKFCPDYKQIKKEMRQMRLYKED